MVQTRTQSSRGCLAARLTITPHRRFGTEVNPGAAVETRSIPASTQALRTRSTAGVCRSRPDQAEVTGRSDQAVLPVMK